jgi:hypothetical protein
MPKSKVHEDMAHQELSLVTGENIKWYGRLNTVGQFRIKASYIILNYDSEIMLLGIFPKELKTYDQLGANGSHLLGRLRLGGLLQFEASPS